MNFCLKVLTSARSFAYGVFDVAKQTSSTSDPAVQLWVLGVTMFHSVKSSAFWIVFLVS